MSVIVALRAFFMEHGSDNTVWIAYSGGLDSHVLLSACAELREEFPFKLHAIHINHGISAHANKWSEHCVQICAAYQVPLTVQSIQVALKTGESLEEVARIKRYAVFAQLLQKNDLLLTAHHEDDQAETLLLQLLRGAGVKGLASMPVIKTFANSYHARPLLCLSRNELEQYAHEKQLRWVEDESNTDIRLTRNFIRHNLLAEIKTRWPSASAAIARSAQHCAEAQYLIEEIAQTELNKVAGAAANTLSASKLLLLDPVKQRLLVRSWISMMGYPSPDARKLAAILTHVLPAKSDARPQVKWANVEIRRFRDDVYLLTTLAKHDAKQMYSWDLTSPLLIPELGILQAETNEINPITVRFRQGGEVANIQNRGRRELKLLFQEWGIPPWLRDRIPLIFCEDELIAVVDHWLHADYIERLKFKWNASS